jgi:hypothetical protein
MGSGPGVRPSNLGGVVADLQHFIDDFGRKTRRRMFGNTRPSVHHLLIFQWDAADPTQPLLYPGFGASDLLCHFFVAPLWMVQPYLPQLATFDNPFFLHRDLLAILLHTPMGGMGHDLRKQQGVTMLENSTCSVYVIKPITLVNCDNQNSTGSLESETARLT